MYRHICRQKYGYSCLSIRPHSLGSRCFFLTACRYLSRRHPRVERRHADRDGRNRGKGEIVAKLLWCRVKDALSGPNRDARHYSVPLRPVSFLKAFCTTRLDYFHLDSFDSTYAPTISFTHFSYITYTAKFADLGTFYKRRMVIGCKRYQRGVDIMTHLHMRSMERLGV